MTIEIAHPDTLSTPANPNVGIDSTKWNRGHTLTQAGERMLGKATAGDGNTAELTAADVGSFLGIDLTLDANKPVSTATQTALDGKIASSLLTTRGDLLYRDATAPARLAKGAANTVLTMGADDPAYSTLSALLDAAIGSTRGMLLLRGSSSWGALAIGSASQVLTSNGTDPAWAASTGGGGSTRIQRHTNLLPHSSFIRGAEGWAFRKHAVEASYFVLDGDSSSALLTFSARSQAQMNASATGKSLYIGPSRPCLVDPSKRYMFGVWSVAYGASLPLTGFFKIHCLNINLGLISTLSVAISVSSTSSGTTSLYTAIIEAIGGSAPAFPAGTVYVAPLVGFDSDDAQGMHVYQMFAVREDEYPGNFATAVQNSGGGTHEAVSDGTHLYVISHGLNELTKFDADMTRVATITLDDYPHDIVIVGTDIWVTSHDAQSLQRISLASFTVTNTYAISSAKNGFGLGTDGTNLWLGAGTSAQGCALYSVNTTTGAQTLLSSDLNTGAANLPIQYLDGSLWVVHETNATVQRINPSGGATIATIATGLTSYIYGLGAGDGYVFACGQNGVAQIDVATNTVVNTYPFRELMHGSSNVAVVNGRAYAGGQIGVAVIDYAAGTFEEIITEAGVVKWCKALPDDTVAVGYFASPIIHILSAA